MASLRNALRFCTFIVFFFAWTTAITADDWKHYLKPGPSVQPPQVEGGSAPEVAQQGTGKSHFEHGRLRIGINQNGAVDRVEVVKKVGFGLDEKAVEQVKTWKFKPAMLDGHPVSVQVYVDIKYKLYDSPKS